MVAKSAIPSDDVNAKGLALTNDEDTLRDIASVSDVMDLFAKSGISVTDVTDLGSGFVVTDKSQLVKVPFVVLSMKTVKGDFGPMVVIHLVTTEDSQPMRKCIIVDGSTGIYDQAVKYLEKGYGAGLRFPRGLVRSDYTFTNDKGTEQDATTYYLSS